MKIFLLLLTLTSFNIMANTNNSLTLYFIPSPIGMDWSSPANLAVSAIKNRLSLKSRFMGHVFVELECAGKRELTGMVGKKFDYLNQLLVENRGLGVLYHSFEGTLENQQEVEDEIKELSEDGSRMNFVKFNLNEGHCQRLSAYLKEYRSNNVGRYYGLANRPLYGEGAGCSAFGASFVEVAGLLDQDLTDGWSQSVNIPLEFAGPPLSTEGVSLLKVIFNAKSWADEKKPYKKIFFWSPDKMHEWVKNKIGKASVEKQFSVIKLNKSKGIQFDKSHLPAPQGPIWQQHLDPSILKK